MAKFEHIYDIVDSLCLRSDDPNRRKKGLFLDCANDTYNDLNLTTVKMGKRELFQINKRTNTLDLPSNCLDVASVSIIDHRGVIWPVFRNDDFKHKDIVDVSAMKDCACENKCGYSLCNLIKGYESIVTTQSDFLPNGNPISFTCIERISVEKNGFVYKQKQYPQRIYTNGVWTNTILVTINEKLCQVEVDQQGCVCDSPENESFVFSACGVRNNDGIPFGGDANSFCGNPKVDTWRYHCNSELEWFGVQCGAFHRGCNEFRNIYNIEEGDKRLFFPPDFGWSKALVRWYSDVELSNMYVPIVAKQTFMTGLQYFSVENNDKKQGLANIFGAKYSRQKFGLLLELNKGTIDDMRMTLTPPIYIPSYIGHHRHGEYRGHEIR